MRKRIEALLPGKSGRAASGLPCGGDMSAASPAYPPAPSGEREPYAAANRIGEYPHGRCGKLRSVRVGKVIRIPRDAIYAFLGT